LTDASLAGKYEAIPLEIPTSGYRRLTLRLVDTSPRAVPGSVALAVLDGNGNILTPASDTAIAQELSGTQDSNPPAAVMSSLSLVRGFYGVNLSLPSVGSEQLAITATERNARTQSATLVIDGALQSRKVVLLYDGAPLSWFSSAELSASFAMGDGRVAKSTLAIRDQPRVSSIPLYGTQTGPIAATAFRTLTTVGSGMGGPCPEVVSCVAHEPQDANRFFVASTLGIAEYTASGRFIREMPAPSSTRRPSISALSALTPALANADVVVFAADRACALCGALGASGIIAFESGPPGTLALAGRPIALTERNTDFVSVGTAPVGVLAVRSSSQPDARSTLYVAARNSIFSLDVEQHNGQYTVVSGPRLLAGSNVANNAGTGYRDGVGQAARFDFPSSGSVGIAADTTVNPTTLFIADPGNNRVREIDLATKRVATFSELPGAPEGVALDSASGQLYVAVPKMHAVYLLRQGAAPLVLAGEPFGSGTNDGFGISPYPLQFAAGNPVTQGASVAHLFRNLPLGTNATLPAVQAHLSLPSGVAFDPQSLTIFVAESGVDTIRTIK
jgi:DNA-binding beta-propeller fold protein YncE